MIDLAPIRSVEPLTLASALGLVVARGAPARGTIRVSCPWHEDAKPSCDLAHRGGVLVACCRSCGAGGDALAVVAAARGLDVRRDFRRVAREAADLLGVSIGDDGQRSTPRPRRPAVVNVAHELDLAADDFLAGRPMRLDALERTTTGQLVDALEVLAEADAIDRAEQDARDDELDAMADDVLAAIAQREAAWLTM